MSRQEILNQNNTLEFIKKASLRHNNKYDYSKAIYVNAKTKIVIICRIHGEFSQLPRRHLKGQKCPKCASSECNNYRKITFDDFVRRSNIVHNNKYKYIESEIKNANSVVDIICDKHGVFKQRISVHMHRGSGCKLCNKRSINKEIKLKTYNTEWFVCRAISVHGDKYSYINTVYNGSDKDITILCDRHGSFKQIARDHLKGCGCPKCSLEKLSYDNRRTLEEFITESNNIHYKRYDYSLVDYKNQYTPVTIICKDHGEFQQTPKHHLRGQGCSLCNISSGHNGLLNFIKSKYHGKILVNDRNALNGLEIDIYLPDINLGFEFNGLYYHSFNRLETTREIYRHADKLDISGIRIIQIFENEWLEKRNIIESMICHYLGLSYKIYARNCIVSELTSNDFMRCINDWHIAGPKYAACRYGLYFDNQLVSAIGFSRHNKHSWEIIRYATKSGCVVVGGLSKMFNKFLNDHNPPEVMTYADRRISVGNCYNKIGFKLVKVTRPNYFYVKGSKLFSRLSFQKHKLKDKLSVFDPNLSESANMFNNGFRRLWDAGHMKFLWSRIDNFRG